MLKIIVETQEWLVDFDRSSFHFQRVIHSKSFHLYFHSTIIFLSFLSVIGSTNAGYGQLKGYAENRINYVKSTQFEINNINSTLGVLSHWVIICDSDIIIRPIMLTL